jgi:hypothetical protein
MKESELVVIREFPQRIDAEMAHSALQARGVKSVISADDVGRQYVGIIGPVRLLVRLDEAEVARQILRLQSH